MQAQPEITWQDLIARFHDAAEHEIGIGPNPDFDNAFRRRLIAEEGNETISAMQDGDIVEIVDGLCDLIYVALGTAVAMGVHLDPIFREVHRTNMAKVEGGIFKEETNATGSTERKLIKPQGWESPRIKEMLIEQGWKL